MDGAASTSTSSENSSSSPISHDASSMSSMRSDMCLNRLKSVSQETIQNSDVNSTISEIADRAALKSVNATSSQASELSSDRLVTKIYFGVDSFEDLQAIRCQQMLNCGTSDCVSRPNFYGDADSAYDSSNESVRISGKDIIDEHRKSSRASSSSGSSGSSTSAATSISSSMKYFTLPSSFGRRLKRQKAQNSADQHVATIRKPAHHRFFSLQENISDSHSLKSGISMVSLSEPSNSKIGLDNQPSFHCCCLLGCHNNNNFINSASLMSQSTLSLNGSTKIIPNHQCCQNRLETLWEEPLKRIETSSISSSLSSLTSDLDNISLTQSDITGHTSSGWLKGPLLRAFRRKSRSNGKSGTEERTAILEARVSSLQKLLEDRDDLIDQIKMDSMNSFNQMENMRATIQHMRAEMVQLKQERDELQKTLSIFNRINSGPSRLFQTQLHIANLDSIGCNATIKCGTQYIGSIGITSATTWEDLDAMIEKTFNGYFQKALDSNCIVYYLVGQERSKRVLLEPYKTRPELLPFGYLVRQKLIIVVIDETRI